jgi:hypothetical protein
MTLIKHIVEKFEYFLGQLIGHKLSNPSGRVVIISSAHKVGSTWLFNMVADLGNMRRIRPPAQFNDAGTLIIDHGGLSSYFKFLYGNAIFKSHSNPPNREPDDNVRIVNIYRDPRDVIVSNIFYLTKLEPHLGGWNEDFRAMDEIEQIKYFIVNGDFSLSKLEKWSDFDGSFKIKYEDLLKDSFCELQKLFKWLGIIVKKDQIEKTIQNFSLRRMAEQKPDRSWFFRKGISGDWKNYFNAECAFLFKNSKNGRWNNLLLKMGYEQDENWSV